MRRKVGVEKPAPNLHMALQPGKLHWKFGFRTGLGREPRYRTIRVGVVERMSGEIEVVRKRFNLPEEAAVVGCYKASRDGFWLHPCLVARGMNSHVVDSPSI